MLDGDLVIRLDAALPADVTVGSGTVVFVCGTCYSSRAPTASLTLTVDGAEQPLMAFGMPRLDVLRACGVAASYRSGFWGLARIGPRTGTESCVLAVRARLEDGREAVAELGRIPV